MIIENFIFLAYYLTSNLFNMLHSKLISLLILLNITIAGYGFTNEYSKSINWSGVKTFNEDGYSKKFITFDGSQITGEESLPAFIEKFLIHTLLKILLVKKKY